MKKIFKKVVIIMILLLIRGIYCGGDEVLAAEEAKTIHESDKVLEVNISKANGVSLLPKEKEVLYTNAGVNYALNTSIDKSVFSYVPFTIDKNGYLDRYLEYTAVCQYAVSTDKGMNYSEYKDIKDGKFCLDPAAVADGIYYVKFRKLEEFNKKESLDPPVPDVPISINQVDMEATGLEAASESPITLGLSKKELKTLETIVMDEGIHAINSVEYAVCVDTVIPAAEFKCSGDISAWSNKNIKCSLLINDTGSRLDKLVITNDDENVLDETYSEDDNATGKEKEFVISSESQSAEGSELVILVSDKAGNTNRIVKKLHIDKTAPGIEFDTSDNAAIYNRNHSVKVRGEDMYPDMVSVAYTVKRADGEELSLVEASTKTLSELNDSELINIKEDGDYIVECHATDQAGNASKVIKRSFRVDKTAPAINLLGINDDAVLGYEAELIVNAMDNFDDYTVELTGSIITDKGTSNLKLADYRMEGRESNNTYYFNADGEYHISAVIEDSAGNSNHSEITFVVDTVIPVITVSKGITAGNTNITNTPPVISYRINENNYSTAVVSCKLRRKSAKGDMELYLEPDWSLSSAQSDFALEISEEGSYEAVVSVIDAAGNSASKTVTFTLDMTSPEIDYVGDLNQKYVKSFKLPDNFSEYIKDDTGVSYETYINSRNYDANQEISTDGKYILKVSAVDDAGNQAEKTIEFIVDSTNPRVVIEGMDESGNVSRDEPLILSLYEEDDFFTSVKVNGVEQITEEHQNEVKINVPDYGDYTIEVEAADMAENVLVQTIEAKCANASPVEMGTATVKTLKQAEQKGSNKGLRVFLIILTVLILAGSVAGASIYFIKQNEANNQ